MFAAATPAPFGKGPPMIHGHVDGWSAWQQFWHCATNGVNIRTTRHDHLGVRAFAKHERIELADGTDVRMVTTMDFTIGSVRVTCEYILRDGMLRLVRTERG
jgi:hypothetical protein